MGDLDMFIEWGQAMQRGEYAGLYPLPFAWAWAVLSAIPRPFLIAGVLLESALLLVALFKRRALVWVWYAPFLMSLAMGQLTMIWLSLVRLNRWWAWLLLTLKPHWMIFALPGIVAASSAERRRFVLSAAALYGFTLVVRPQWPTEWLRAILAEERLIDAFSLGGAPVLFALAALLFLLLRRLPWLTLATAFNPTLRAYDHMILAGRSGPSLIVVSWIALALSHAVQAAWPYGLLGVWYGLQVVWDERGREWLTIRLRAARRTTSLPWMRSQSKRPA